MSAKDMADGRGGEPFDSGQVLSEGDSHFREGRFAEAVDAYGRVHDRLGHDPDPDPDPARREQAATALFNMGAALGRLDRWEEAVAAYEQVEARYGEDPALHQQAALSLVNLGVVLGRLGRWEEAVAANERLDARYGRDRAPALRDLAAVALVNMGAALRQLDRWQEAVAAYEQVDARFGQDSAPALREQAAAALVGKGVALEQLGRWEEAVAAYEQVDARFGQDPAPALREQTAMALVTMGAALAQLGRRDEGLAAYEQVDSRYGRDPSPAMQSIVAKARELARGLDAAEAGDPAPINGSTEPPPPPPPQPDPAPRPGRWRAGGLGDTVPARDLGLAERLGIGDDVEMLVSVLAARDTPMPLAVGLFGDWGSGKSFFMALMEERVNDLQKQGRVDPTSPFCTNVRQVRFNAWHFVDHDLWASLAATLFDQLARPESEQAATESIQQAMNRVIEAEKQARKAANQLADLERQAKSSPAATKSALVAAVTTAVQDKHLLANLEKLAGDDRTQPAGQPGLVSADALVQSVAATQQAGRETRAVWQLFRQELAVRWTSMLAAAVGVAAVLLLLAWLLQWPSSARALSVAAALVAAITPAATATRKVLERIRDVRLSRDAAVAAQRDDLERARKNVEDLRTELAEQTDPGSRMRSFVRERAASPVYRQRLGSVSQLRADFEQLVRLMDPTSGERTPEVAEVVPAPDRIILYIDDLDRCPQHKVVDILQAIHLLLAFPLFAIVVGVDSRWLTRSLSSRYHDLLEDPADYLEKIFQIPFALEPMSRRDPSPLLQELTKPPALPDSAQGRPAVRPREQAPSGTGPAEPDRSQGLAAAGSPRTEPPPRAPEAVGPLDPGEAATEPSPVPSPIDRRDAVLLDEAERRHLAELGHLLPTPRAAKRFVSTYRMLRVSVPADQLEAFLPPNDGYQVPALLTALMVGLPRQAPALFQTLQAADPTRTVGGVVASFDPAMVGHFDDLSDAPVEAFQYWIPRVSRFSFKLHEPSAGPPATGTSRQTRGSVAWARRYGKHRSPGP